jgi:hypothetical protein
VGVLHVVKRHGGKVEDVVVIELRVARGQLRRRRKGLWFSKLDAGPAQFRRLIDFAEVSASPADA